LDRKILHINKKIQITDVINVLLLKPAFKKRVQIKEQKGL